MKTAAVMMVRDEQDVIGPMVRHALEEVDHMYVLDNGSTDNTRPILDGLVAAGLPLTVQDDPERGYFQSNKMTALAERAANEGHRFIVPMDADEIWTARPAGRIRDVLPTLDGPIYPARLYDHIRTGLDRVDAIDPPGVNPFWSMVWRKRAPGGLPKVAFRWEPRAVIAQGNHHVWLPSLDGVEDPPTPSPALTVHHFQVRSPEQFLSKVVNGAAAYAAAGTDLPADMGNHWRSWGELFHRYGEHAIQEIFDTYFWCLSPVDAGLVLDPAPYRILQVGA